MKARMILYGSLAVSTIIVAFACIKHSESGQMTVAVSGVTTSNTAPGASKELASNRMPDKDPAAEARAVMLAKLGFGTNGGHAVTVTYKQQ